MMKLKLVSYLIIFTVILSACGTLEKKTILINPNDDKGRVLEIMGPPGDRQMEGQSVVSSVVSGLHILQVKLILNKFNFFPELFISL